MKVAIINYGSGNIRSVKNALNSIGCDYFESSDLTELKNASHIILPGVGSFGGAISALKKRDLDGILQELVIDGGRYYLGICVGMQVLGESGDEFGKHKGLGWVRGSSKRLDVTEMGLNLPHVGWNDIIGNLENSKLLSSFRQVPAFYFVNSYSLCISEKVDFEGHTYFGTKFLSVIEQDNIFGVQFHPEKSQAGGLQLLKNFVTI
jgi:imidazole glycerol-phosphate synthase subunit HisH